MYDEYDDFYDEEHEEADRELEKIIALIVLIYRKAAGRIRRKANEYMKDINEQDKQYRRRYEQGIITASEYKAWRMQMMSTTWYYRMSNDLSSELYLAKVKAAKVVNDALPKIYAGGMNWSWFSVGKQSGIDFGYRPVVNTKTMINLMRDMNISPTPVTIDSALAIVNNRKYLNSAVMQGLTKGETIPEIAERISVVMADRDMNNSVRVARTMVTCAENSGRYQAGCDMAEKGIEVSREWMATLDDRTRHEHRQLDGQVKPYPDPFEIDGETIRFAGDPLAAPYMTINCRCTERKIFKGLSGYEDYRTDSEIDGQSYKEWKEGGR